MNTEQNRNEKKSAEYETGKLECWHNIECKTAKGNKRTGELNLRHNIIFEHRNE